MRYSIISFPLHFAKPVSSDFRMVAYAIAWIRKAFCREVYIIDTDTGGCIDQYCCGSAAVFMPRRHAALRRFIGVRN